MRPLALLSLFLLVAGCMGAESIPAAETAVGSVGERPVVVALIDSGTDPYYPVFRVPDDSFVLRAVSANVTRVEFPLPSGHGDPIERDLALWEAMEPGVLYHFAGTRLLGISLDQDRDPRYHYVRDASFHGVATSYLAAREAPDVVVVAVQVGMGPCLTDTSCLFSPTIAAGMEWAADQEWIDIISVSLGIPANAPDPALLHAEVERYLAASERASRAGKIILNGAGNTVVPPHADYFNGPPWVIAVGGVESEAKGEHVLTARSVDVVANFTDYAPMYGEGDMAWRSGTSIATPIVAGTLAEALHRVRQAQPDLTVTTQMLRDALNATGFYFNATDWDPSPPGRKPLPDDLVMYASLPVLVQPQMGWGYIDGSLADEIARRVLEGDLAPPPEKQQAILFQAQWQKAREDYWSSVGRATA